MELIGIFQILLGTLVRSAPVHLVQIAGLVWAYQRLESQPRRAKFALIGLGISLANGLLAAAFNSAVPMMAMRINTAQIGLALGVTGFIFGLIAAVGWGFVVWALFVEEA